MVGVFSRGRFCQLVRGVTDSWAAASFIGSSQRLAVRQSWQGSCSGKAFADYRSLVVLSREIAGRLR